MDKIKRFERLRLPEGKHLTVAEHTVRGGHPQHWHSYFEIEIVLSGEGKYIINDVAYDISENDVFLLNSTDFHYLEASSETKLLNISFDHGMLSDKDMAALVFGKAEKAYAFERDAYERLVNAAGILLYECQTEGDCQKPILEYIIKCLLRKNTVLDTEHGSEEHNRGIKNAILYMEMHFAERITLEDVASAAGYTPTYFSELFAKLTGATYTETLVRLRLSHAKSMLANGFSVSDACFLSGFGSLSNFYEAFKQQHKISPSEYKSTRQRNPIL